ncbi:hypothetical protein [Rhizobium aouanii]|uniref:Uncharacterized protein n=1 Tax=Rhizobium aouanii TaxID=3118145 RepID=A0ABU8CTQ2_9HYPH
MIDGFGYSIEIVWPSAFDEPNRQGAAAGIVFRPANGGRMKKWHRYFFLLGRCVRAEPAAVFEFLPVLSDFRTFEAALPAFFDVVSLFAIGHSSNHNLGK